MAIRHAADSRTESCISGRYNKGYMSSIESETLTKIIKQAGRFRPLELQRGDFVATAA